MSNTFRKEYRALTAVEAEHVEQIKDAAERLEHLIVDKAGTLHEGHRYISIAMTHLETAVMFATKAYT